jgi:hypothetical protein
MMNNKDASFVRRRQGLVIIDSSGSEEEADGDRMESNHTEIAPAARPKAATRITGWDYDDASDSSSSLEGYIQALRITDKTTVPDNIETEALHEDEGSDSGESVDSFEMEIPAPPTLEEEAKVGIEKDSAFAWDRSTNEVYLSPEKTTNGTEWPDLRVPVGLFKRLYDYQKDGVQWMATLHLNRIGGCLGDDMGMVRINFLKLALNCFLGQSHDIIYSL